MTIELDHIGLSVENYERAKAFYVAALAPLRMVAIMEYGGDVTGGEPVVGFGADGKPFFWISGGGKTSPHTHIAIRAESRAQVDAFHAGALAAGGKDNGGPGVREIYHPNYYGAFVLDPDGHNIEAVFHGAPAVRKAPARKAAVKKPAARKAPARKAAARKPTARKAASKKASGRKKPGGKPTAREGKGKR